MFKNEINFSQGFALYDERIEVVALAVEMPESVGDDAGEGGLAEEAGAVAGVEPIVNLAAETLVTGLLIVNVCELEVPPPGAGVTTVTAAVQIGRASCRERV